MKLNTRHRLLARVSGLLATGLLAVLAVAPVNAGRPLPDFTGYTRIGYPNSEAADGKAGDKVAPVARDAKAIGVTVYYMVLDRRNAGTSRAAVEGDTFGTGIKNFDSYFVAGRNADGRRLDTRSRYLYLYQVVNDSGREAAVRNTSVRLIIDPRLITSWGHFSERQAEKGEKGVDLRRGLGFTAAFAAPGKADSMIRPMSTENLVGDKAYRTPAPPVKAPSPWGITSIPVNQRLTAPGEEVGKEPEAVVLLSNGFGEDRDGTGGFRSNYQLEEDRWLYPGETRAVRVPTREKWESRWPCIRAFWNEEDPIKPRQRSTIFGFTSEYPPVYRETQVIGRSLGIGFGAAPADEKAPLAAVDAASEPRDAADEITPVSFRQPFDFDRLVGQAAEGTGTPPVIGTVPTPVPPVARVTPAAAESGGIPPAPVGSLGGESGGGGGMSSMPFGGGPAGGGGMMGGGTPGGGLFGGGGGNRGGGGGMMGGGGGDQGQGNQDKGQGQNQGSGININVRVDPKINVNQSQQQQQQQKQQQGQQQGQGQSQSGGGGGTVIPAPPAWILGLLGAPVFVFLKRRRKSEETAAATVES